MHFEKPSSSGLECCYTHIRIVNILRIHFVLCFVFIEFWGLPNRPLSWLGPPDHIWYRWRSIWWFWPLDCRAQNPVSKPWSFQRTWTINQALSAMSYRYGESERLFPSVLVCRSLRVWLKKLVYTLSFVVTWLVLRLQSCLLFPLAFLPATWYCLYHLMHFSTFQVLVSSSFDLRSLYSDPIFSLEDVDAFVDFLVLALIASRILIM